MLEIVLIEMPFADIGMPSLALSRLKYVVEQAHPGRVHIRILYLSHEFAAYFGINFYQEVALGMKHLTSGLGDWIFRQIAFPDVPDNTDQYLPRHYASTDKLNQALRGKIEEKRPGLNAFFDHLIQKYQLDHVDIAGFTSFFSQNLACFALARKIKLVNPRAVIVMGGSNCEDPMGKEILKNVPCIDHVFSGPALVSFPAFVGLQLAGAPISEQSIDGLFSKTTSNGKSRNVDLLTINELKGSHGLGQQLDINTRIPLKYDEFFESYERLSGSPVVPMIPFETSRGCWWGEKAHCTFCGLNTMSMASRVMDPVLAIEQFQSLFAYASRCERLFCIDSILPKNYLTDVLPHLNTPPSMSIFYEVKSDLSKDDMRILAKARVTHIQPGIEALASSTLKLMKKGSTSFQNIALLKNCVIFDVAPSWNLLIGFPREEETVYQKYLRDLPLLVHLYPPNGVFPIRFDRYSPYFDHSEKYGLNLRPYDFYSMIYPFPDSSMKNIAYYFLDYNFEAPYFIQMVKWIQPLRKAVELWKTAWYGGDRSRPRLEIRSENGKPFIFDSRFGTAVEHRLSEDAMALLGRLNSPVSLDRLELEFKPAAGCDLKREIATLSDLGLLFEEGGRFVSLVLPQPETEDQPEIIREVEVVGAPG